METIIIVHAYHYDDNDIQLRDRLNYMCVQRDSKPSLWIRSTLKCACDFPTLGYSRQTIVQKQIAFINVTNAVSNTLDRIP